MVPKTYAECNDALNQELSPASQIEFMQLTRKELIRTHHGLGQWIRNNWGLWAGGPLSDDMKTLGFTHPDDIAAAEEIVTHAAEADVAEAFHGMFADLGRKFSGGQFLKIETSPKPHPKPKPRFARRDLLRELVCDDCGRDYGVYAISMFCPDCGAPNIHLHFAREATLVREQVELAGKLNPEQGELAYSLLVNAHADVLTACEA